MKFYPQKPYKLNSNLYSSSKNFVLKLSCDIVPEVAKGQGAEVEKGLHGVGDGGRWAILLYWT